MMQQWHFCKEKAKDALLFFRLGDFYEAFYEDAEKMSKELGLTLTSRQNIPMCGVPVHSAEQYLDKLLAKGFKIALAEQMEDPRQTKGIVKRDIVRFLSPGSVMQSCILSEQSNNFFVSISAVKNTFSLAITDISTGEFRVLKTAHLRDMLSEICRLKPAEILTSISFAKEQKAFLDELLREFHYILNTQEDRIFEPRIAICYLEEHFSVDAIASLSLENSFSEISSAGALICYLKEGLYLDLSHIQTLEIDPFKQFMCLDKTCLKNLNIFPSEDQPFSLIKILDKTKTPMGARLLRKWVKRPLLSHEAIHERLQSVEELYKNVSLVEKIVSSLKTICDIERIIMRIASGFCSPKDFSSLKESLLAAQNLKKSTQCKSQLLADSLKDLEDTSNIISLIEKALVDTPPHRLHDAPTFRKGYHKELDELRALQTNSQNWIASYQETLRKDLGIKTLKVSYTKAFGYYIDVSKGQASKMPDSFVRRQTLTNSERFLSEELREFAYKILSAEEQIKAIEKTLFDELKKTLSPFTPLIQKTAKALSVIDVLQAFAENASTYGYTRPIIQKEDVLMIEQGRHPIIEQTLGFSSFIPNDTYFASDSRLHLITGPNMAGKSTYIRQSALLVVLAQIGSFVPAKSMRLKPVDQIFSRIGASDDIASGESTFMVEMKETAAILQNVTENSLVILDEIGRGTSTYDGISIAWSVAEYLIKKIPAKTLFATHYRELTEMEEKFSLVRNFQVSVKEDIYGIVFLHKILPGKAPKSYAIHVAKLAGMPRFCLEKAKNLLKELEEPNPEKEQTSLQMELFHKQEVAWIEELAAINMDLITPKEAHQMLYDLQEKIGLL